MITEIEQIINTQASNPLLNPNVVSHDVDFTKIKASDFAQAFDILLPRLVDEHNFQVSKAPLTYHNLFEVSPVADQLESILGILNNLNSVVQTPEIREVYDNYIGKISEVYQTIGLDDRGYYKIKEFMNTTEYQELSAMRQKMIQEILSNYELNGINLPSAEKEKLKQISVKLSELTTLFDNNVTDVQSQKEITLTREQLEGLPQRAMNNAQLLDDGRFKIMYSSGLFSDILTYCTVEKTRQAVYEKQLDTGIKEGYDNRLIVDEIVSLKRVRAQILGFETHAHKSLLKRMVSDPAKALSFVEDLANKSFKQAKIESDEVSSYGEKLLNRPVNFYDRAFIIDKMQKELLNVDDELLRQYFPVKKVVSGLFDIIENLYSIRFVQNTKISTWHEDVLVYDLEDTLSAKPVGRLYMDLYQRAFKASGAWMNGVVSRHVDSKGVINPIAYITGNAPKDKTESTFEFDEIITLFHEMGHALHHLLTQVDEEYFSGINHVQHDAVELPSQFMENFCWDYEILKVLSAHTTTGEVLPFDMYENLLKKKYFLAASQMLRQASFAQLDLRIYTETNKTVLEIEKEVFEKWKTRPLDERSFFTPVFSHIFAGGYSAGYYAYKWAEVLSSDAFAALKESGKTYLDQKPTALEFRKHILETGGYEDMAINFENFRGRAPDLTYLLNDYGIQVR